MARRFAFPLTIALAAAALGPLAARGSDPAPSLVRRAIALYGEEHRGELGFSRHLAFRLHAGPFTHDVRNEVGILMRDGEYLKVRYYAAATNGKADDASELQREEDRTNADLAAGRGYFKRPVDPRFAQDYRFAPAPCTDGDGCGPGAQAFSFRSVVHDQQHGHGMLVLDGGTARVQRLSYTLDEPPDHATSAEAVETFGQALPDLWTCMRVEETYHGKLGIIGGTATMTYTHDHFRRFARLDAGLAALSDGTL